MRSIKRRASSMALVAAAACVIGLNSESALAVQLHDRLITYWPLSEGSGATAGDMAPGGSVDDNGTFVSSPTWIDGKFGNGLQFNGVDQHVLVPTSADMDINTNGVTLSAWVKLDQLPSEIATSFSGIYDSAPDNYVMYLDKGNNELRFKATNAGNVATATAQHPGIPASMLNTTDWIHVMGVYDGDNARAKIYFNGQLADITGQGNGAGLYTGPVRAGQVAGMGAQVAATDPFAASSFFQGAISDLAVWNRALGGAEAQYLYNGGTGNSVGAANPNINPLPPIQPLLPTAQPVAYYKFDGDLNNHGTGGSALNATLHDVPGRNDALYSSASFGQGLNLSENPSSVASEPEGGDYLSIDYTLAESGTIATRFTALELYDYVTIWSNSVHQDDWESWVYADGRVAVRGQRGGNTLANNLYLQEDPTAAHHYAFTWDRNGDQMFTQMFVDGELVDQRVSGWQDPGDTFFIGGGVADTGTSNHLGKGVYDEFRIYNAALSEAEILYLSQFAPEVVDTLLGDFNFDGHVDAADYTVWRDGFGGDYDEGDYNDWKSNFGASLGGGAGDSAAVPEPAACAFALIAMVVGGALVRLRR